MRPTLVSVFTLLLAGCVTSPRDTAAEARGYERGYRQATKEQYWIIQNQQRAPAALPSPANPPPFP
jgi:starvation-inducible outer membrane lipoprotein